MSVNNEIWQEELESVLGRLAKLLVERTRADDPPEDEPSNSAKVLLTVEEAAERLRVGRTKVYALIRSGEIPSVQIGRLRRIHVDALNEYAERLTHSRDRAAA